ncbi:hypothetical protein AVEN_110747-1 [Araneus ventricosus]|uniref:Uncharacterized protein n=1 Tax=Araneus ventricosus TaxID=182803 RepID=A0A4Y2LFF7_ARAVE|nr:hypothetical protein AVEN_110747-1 [Araneus ventricosus]
MGEWTSNDENIPERRQEISSLPTGENTPKQARQVFPYPLKEIKLDMSSHVPQYMDDKFTSKYRRSLPYRVEATIVRQTVAILTPITSPGTPGEAVIVIAIGFSYLGDDFVIAHQLKSCTKGENNEARPKIALVLLQNETFIKLNCCSNHISL